MGYRPLLILCESGFWMKKRRANVNYFCLSTDEVNKAASMLTETLKDPDWGHSCSPIHAPFNYWSKYPGSIFSWYENAVRVALKDVFLLAFNAGIGKRCRSSERCTFRDGNESVG